MLWWHLRQLESENIKTLIKAARKLGKSNNSKAVEPLIALLNNKNPTLQKTIAEALGKLGDTRAFEPLIALLLQKNKKPDFIETVIESLLKLNPEHYKDVFPRMVNEMDSATKEAFKKANDNVQKKLMKKLNALLNG